MGLRGRLANLLMSNWAVPSSADLAVVMNTQVLLPTSPNAVAALALAVGRVRGTIQTAGRVPVSVTAGSVPPEALQHALVLTVALLTGAFPNLASLVDADGGKTGFGQLVEQAEQWLDRIEKGASCIGPTDPVGMDGINAVSATNPLYEAVRVGSSGLITEVDLTPYSSTAIA